MTFDEIGITDCEDCVSDDDREIIGKVTKVIAFYDRVEESGEWDGNEQCGLFLLDDGRFVAFDAGEDYTGHG